MTAVTKRIDWQVQAQFIRLTNQLRRDVSFDLKPQWAVLEKRAGRTVTETEVKGWQGQ